jgi:primosomal protein N' (replication factor Y) (superfamily II helicase)
VVYHLNRKLPAGGYVECHHCLTQQKLPPACPSCGSKLSTFGLGTQRVEEELALKFPQLIEGRNMLRIDSDSMTGSRSFHEALDRFGKGEVRVLVGTQMIAKGLDFPGVRLVGVINADTTINLPDFRATERTFQLVNQVAGRCGRGAEPGLTIVQTFSPNSPAIRLAAEHDFESFAALEIAERQRCHLPPATRMARIVVRDEDHLKCLTRARELFDRLNATTERAGASSPPSEDTPQNDAPISNWSALHGAEDGPARTKHFMRLRGPAPCPIARIADKWRQQIEILAPTATSLQRFLALTRSAGMIWSDADMTIDVDPIALL